MWLLVGFQIVDVDALVADPFAVRTAGSEIVFQLFVGDHAPLIEVDQEHFTRLQSALFFDVFGFDRRQDASFAGHDHAIVVGDVIARRAKSVAVEHRADVLAVGEGD